MVGKEPFVNFLRHETKKNVLVRFILVFAVFLIYFFISIISYGGNGILIAFLTWSIFVFGTPIADAGFLLDFPMRLITGIRMIYSEMIVWAIAISLNVYSLFFFSQIYEKTVLLRLLKTILLNPFPYWAIIILSLAGTFLSIYFGDELIDVAKHKDREKYRKHKNKYGIIALLFLISLIEVFIIISLVT